MKGTRMALIPQAHRMENAPLSRIREIIAYAGKLEAAGKAIIHLEIGEPDFDTPAHIVAACKKALDEGKVHYGPVTGIPELRAAVAAHYNRRYGSGYEADEVMITVGVEQGVYLSMNAYLNPGDEILVPDPGYLCYFTLPNIAGATPVSYPLEEKRHFQIDAEGLEKLTTPRTKAILLNSPSNPCGSVLDGRSLRVVADLAERHNLLVISDEVYADMVYGGKAFHSAASLPELKKRLIVLHGFSKYFAMTGWRLGYAAAPAEFMEEMVKIHQYVIMCAPTVSQYAGLEALTNERREDELSIMREAYDERRRVMVDGFRAMGLDCFEPQGAFYVFPSIQSTGLSSEEFCEKLLYERRTAVVPGTAFGESGEGFIRCSYAYSIKSIRIALERIEGFLKTLK